MLINQDQGQLSTKTLERESYLGNIAANHSFRNLQGPCNPMKMTQVEKSGMDSNYNIGKIPKLWDIYFAFN